MCYEILLIDTEEKRERGTPEGPYRGILGVRVAIIHGSVEEDTGYRII